MKLLFIDACPRLTLPQSVVFWGKQITEPDICAMCWAC